MQSPDSQIIIQRFFETLDRIIDAKIIRGVQTFTRKYNINRWNLLTLKKNPGSDIFQPAWLSYLVHDFMISPRWLLTGEGEMFEFGWDADKVREIVRHQRELEKKLNAANKRRGRPQKINEPETPIES